MIINPTESNENGVVMNQTCRFGYEGHTQICRSSIMRSKWGGGGQRIARVSSKSRSRQLLESLDQSRSRQPTNFPVSISLGLETLKSESRSRSR